VRLRAAEGATSAVPGTLSVKLRADQTFDMTDNQLKQRVASAVRGRDGIATGTGSVYFEEDDVVGTLPFLGDKDGAVAAEVFNTARLSGKCAHVHIGATVFALTAMIRALRPCSCLHATANRPLVCCTLVQFGPSRASAPFHACVCARTCVDLGAFDHKGSTIMLPIVVEGVTRRGKVVDASLDPTVSCTHADGSGSLFKLAVGPVSRCTAVFDGEEDGAGDALISVTVALTKGAGRRTDAQFVKVRVFRLVPDTLNITTATCASGNKTQCVLRPIAGLFDESDPDCRMLAFPETTLFGTATFSDGLALRYDEYDVSTMLRLASSDERVLSVLSRGKGRTSAMKGRNAPGAGASGGVHSHS